jgi:hypothetical protein
MSDYRFIREIDQFNTDDYLPQMGWIGDKPIKIYRQTDAGHFFLYDEIKDRLFEFTTSDHKMLNSTEEYESLVRKYELFLQ